MMHHRVRKIRSNRRWRRLNWLSHLRRDERGVQLLEVAIVLPVLLMLFAAIAEFGVYFYQYTTVAKSARLGARYLASKSVTSGSVNWQTKAKNIVVFGNVDGTGSPVLTGLTTDNVTVEYQGGTSGIPDTVTVRIENFKHQPVFDLGKLLKNSSLSLNVDVKPSVTMRYLLTTPSV